MEKLNKDELFSIAINLELKDLLNFCLVDKNIRKQIFQRNEIWMYKLIKDFPDFKRLKVEGKSYKEIYQLLYSLTEIKNKWKSKENIYELYELKKIIYINKRNLNSVSKELGYLSNLEVLKLSYDLTYIPNEISKLSNLRSLDLSDNKLGMIPKEFGNLLNLQKLKLFNNSLSFVPKELGNLSNLKVLDISYNFLTSIPAELGNLLNLKEL